MIEKMALPSTKQKDEERAKTRLLQTQIRRSSFNKLLLSSYLRMNLIVTKNAFLLFVHDEPAGLCCIKRIVCLYSTYKCHTIVCVVL